MSYVVVKDFKDLAENNHIYRAGDPFPRSGVEVSESRLHELSTTENRRKEVLIERVESTDEPDTPETPNTPDEPPKEFPHHTGGGYYELSNGEKVKGKDAAIEAEQALAE